jgi:hypothetical protein
MVTLDFAETFNDTVMIPKLVEARDKLVDIMIRKCPVKTGATLRGEDGIVETHEPMMPLTDAEDHGEGESSMGGQVLGYTIIVGAGPPGNPSEKYAVYLQCGTSKMAPRPLLPTEDEVVAVLQEVFGG